MGVNQRKLTENLTGYAFSAPAIILFLTVGLFTVVFSIFISFHVWGGVGIDTARFNGLKNYESFLLGRKPLATQLFYSAILNNFKVALFNILFTIPIALCLAVLIIRSAGKLGGFFRTIYFIPMVASGVATNYAWQGLFSPDGTLNKIFQLLGLNFLVVKDGLLGNMNTALIGIIITVIWGGIPGTMILYYAGLLSIDNNLYESADIDGASKFQMMTKITWPLLKPMTTVAIINMVSGSFQMFENVWVLTRGGPANSTQIIGTLVYQCAFGGLGDIGGFGMASAIGWNVFLVTLTCSLLSLRVMKTDY